MSSAAPSLGPNGPGDPAIAGRVCYCSWHFLPCRCVILVKGHRVQSQLHRSCTRQVQRGWRPSFVCGHWDLDWGVRFAVCVTAGHICAPSGLHPAGNRHSPLQFRFLCFLGYHVSSGEFFCLSPGSFGVLCCAPPGCESLVLRRILLLFSHFAFLG